MHEAPKENKQQFRKYIERSPDLIASSFQTLSFLLTVIKITTQPLEIKVLLYILQ